MSPWDKKNHSPRSRAFLSLQLLKTLENTLESVMVAGKRSTVEIVEGEFMDLKAEAWVGKRHPSDRAELYCRNCGKVVKRCSAFEMESAVQWLNLEQRCQCGAKLWFVRDI